MTFRIPIKDDNAQGCIDLRKKIEQLAKNEGAVDIEAHGDFGSTMMDVPNT